MRSEVKSVGRPSLRFGTELIDIYKRSPHTDGLTDYNAYRLNRSELLISLAAGCTVMGGIAFVFFKSFWAIVLLSAFGCYYPALRRRRLIEKRKAQLKLQFKQLLSALSSSLSAGRSVESAFREALNDLKLLYPGSGTMIVKELEILLHRLDNGETVESALMQFSKRAHVEDIAQFADVFVICKRTGGNLVQVIRRTAGLIQDKLDIEQDIQVQIAQKKFESKVLILAPVVMVAVLSSSSPDYMEPLYAGAGRLLMLGALTVLAACYRLTQKIMNIPV
ncbi:type II secretion system F family protein [Paenibacillus filicis]|uniref:Type II secretion system F family protein n=1 Tax=Paenibacillus gyeongsangnamensis TaxID=3388067 RepID=A0ABT4QGK6_9BACL|nr:type II secretion system F family protein [Paenibacillus filicis]MCZ8515871.1 type II secretion system F family protein [Paenibacillus filicis]